MAKIIDHLSQGEILAQMAEELAEAAQAAHRRRSSCAGRWMTQTRLPRLSPNAGSRWKKKSAMS